MLGALKAGRTYVPLDPQLPRARTEFIVGDSASALVVTNAAGRETAAGLAGGASLLDVDEIRPDAPSGNLEVPVPSDAVTWLLYTSGSTGRPKGVMQTHRNILHYAMVYTEGLRVCPEDRFSLLFSCSVNAAAHDIYTALLTGASIHPFNVRREGVASIADWLRRQQITIYCSVPTLFRHFCESLGDRDAFTRLRLIKLVGEPVYRKHLALYRKHFPDDCVFVDRLGSTETGSIRWFFADKKTRINDAMMPVGYPTRDNEILLLDERGNQVPVGEVGEICVRSRYLSPGYWRRPDRTRAAFQPDPDGGDRRIYHTGDLGRMEPDGCLICMGRKDFQVKIRGYRIELGEVEAALEDLDEVREAAVMGHERADGDQILVAYMVPAGAGAPSVTRLRRRLSETLPEHMIPSRYVTLDSLPLAANGKVLRKSLPVPDRLRPRLDNPCVGPRTATEEIIARIWRDVLALDHIGVEDDFVELGGTSLMAAQVVSCIMANCGVRLPMPGVFRTRTIAELASLVDAHRAGGAPQVEAVGDELPSLLPIKKGGERPPLFLVSFGTAWEAGPLAEHLGPDQPVYALRPLAPSGGTGKVPGPEELAGRCVRDILSVQPDGRCVLAGGCSAGILAFAAARQLRAGGHRVPLVVLFDVDYPLPAVVPHRLAARLLRLPRVLRRVRLMPPREQRAYVRRRLQIGLGGLLSGVFRRRPPDAGTEQIRAQLAMVDDPARIGLWRYRPTPYDGRVALFLSRDTGVWFFHDARLDWRRVVRGGCTVERVPGEHDHMLEEPYVRAVAQRLNACLDAALAAGG
jgi:amino acid adenylation domain-containing protein